MLRQRSLALLALALALCGAGYAAIWLSAIEGTCVDEHGQPVAGAVLRFAEHSTGRRFQATTDQSGRFFFIAVESGVYELQVHRRGGAEASFPGVQIPWSAQTLTVNVDLRRSTVEVTRRALLPEAYRSEGTPASLASLDADPLAAEINRKLAAARQYSERGDWLAALDPLTSAVRLDPRRDLPQALLADAYCHAARQAPEEAPGWLQKCIAGYRAAIAISGQPAYHNNLGTALAAAGRYDEAFTEFRAAEQAAPGDRALYQQNIGVVLLEQAEHRPEADAPALLAQAALAFEAALRSEPGNADAQYWRSIVLLRLAAATPPKASYREVASAFRSYLALAPGGPHALEVRGLLAAVEELATQEGK